MQGPIATRHRPASSLRWSSDPRPPRVFADPRRSSVRRALASVRPVIPPRGDSSRPAPTSRSVPRARWITPENQIARRPQSVAATAHSCPFLPLGLRKRNASPRTQCLHVTENLRRLGAILLVRGKRSRLGTELFLGAETGGIDQC